MALNLTNLKDELLKNLGNVGSNVQRTIANAPINPVAGFNALNQTVINPIRTGANNFINDVNRMNENRMGLGQKIDIEPSINRVPTFNPPDFRSQRVVNAPFFGGLTSMGGDLVKSFINTPSTFIKGQIQAAGGAQQGNTQQLLAGLGNMGSATLNVAPFIGGTESIGANVIKNLSKDALPTAFKSGAKIGATYGGIQGFLSGLDQNRNKSLQEQLGQSGVEALKGAAFGYVAGGLLGGGSQWLAKKPSQIFDEIGNIRPNLSPEANKVLTAQYIRNKLGQFAPKQYQETPQELAFVRDLQLHPLTPAEIKALDIKFGWITEAQPGMSIKKLSKDEGEALRKLGGQPTQTVDPLIQEAKKYKSAEEFVSGIKNKTQEQKKQIIDFINKENNRVYEDFSKNSKVKTLYHGTPKEFSEFKLTEGDRTGMMGVREKTNNKAIFLSENKDVAQEFGQNRATEYGGKPKLLEVSTNIQNPLDITSGRTADKEINNFATKLLEKWDGVKRTKIPQREQYWLLDQPEFVDYVKAKGYDSVKFSEQNATDKAAYAVFDPQKLLIKNEQNTKIKSLTDIWKQANKVEPITPPTQGVGGITKEYPDPIDNPLYKEMRDAQDNLMKKIDSLKGKYKTDAEIPSTIKKELNQLKSDWNSKVDLWEKTYKPVSTPPTQVSEGLQKPGIVQPVEGLTKFDTPEIVKARQLASQIPETININSPERNLLRQNLADTYYGNGAPVKNRRLDLVLGSPASGKSSRLAEPLAKEHGSIIIDSDQIKKQLPEFSNGIGAGAVHKESALISDQMIVNKAISNGDNIVLPRLGKNMKTMQELVDQFRQSGYDVHLHFMDLPSEEAAKRVVTRFNETGRFVDPNYILNVVADNPKKVYNGIKNLEGISSYEQYSNQVPFGEAPKLIERGTNKPQVTGSGGRILQQSPIGNVEENKLSKTAPLQLNQEAIQTQLPSAQSVLPEKGITKPQISTNMPVVAQEGKKLVPSTGNVSITNAVAGEIPQQQQILQQGLSKSEVPPAGATTTPSPASITRENNPISFVQAKANQLYTEALDRFHPLSVIGKKAGADQEMRNALTGYYGAGSTANYHVDFELKPILNKVPISDLRDAAIAMRDVELASRGIKGSNTGNPIAKLEELKQRLGPEKMAEVQTTLKQLYAYQDSIVKKYLVDTGIMSESSYQAMRKNNQFYVPFKRVMDQVDEYLGNVPSSRGAGSVGSQNVLYKIKGSDKQIVDPIESIVESTYKMVGLGKRQEVAKTIVSLKDKLPEGMITPTTKSGPSTMSVFENGKVKHYSVPPEVADAAKGLSEEALNTIVKILAYPTQIFRASATGINPEFMAPNVARDLQSAFVNTGMNPLGYVKGFAHLMKQDQVYQDFLKYGGKTSRISIDRPMLTQTVSDLTSKSGVTIKKPSDLLKVLQVAGEYSEQPTRIGMFQKEFEKGLKAGLSKEEAGARAAYAAQEGTVNFARRGSKTQSINAIYAFLNARAQGVDRLLRTVKNDPKGASVRIGMISVAPAVALYAYNRRFSSYSDPRVVSPSDKQNNFIIMISDSPVPQLGGAQFVKIPKGDVGKLANPVEEFMSYADGKGGDIKKSLLNTLSAFSPVSNAGDVIPTAIRPPAENIANYNFFAGQNIVPEYKKNLPPAYQSSSYTSPTYRALGEKFNVSPAKLQNLVEGYGTGIAKIGTTLTDRLMPDQYQTTRSQQGQDINRTPVLRRFLGGEKRSVQEQQTANESKASSIDFQINDIKSAIKRGDVPLDAGYKQILELQKQQDQALNMPGSTTGGTSGTNKTLSDLQKSIAVKRFTDSDTQTATIGESFYYKDNGDVKNVPINRPIPQPTLTGDPTTDKLLYSKVTSALTARQNDLLTLAQHGAITMDQAITEINQLAEQKTNISKLTAKPKKPAKFTIKKISSAPIKISAPKAIKLPKMQSIKLKKQSTRRFTIKV